jgi:small subunit ribosomal protein S5
MYNKGKRDNRRERRDFDRREEEPVVWDPKTRVGQQVKSGQIISVEQIFATGKPIKETEIVDALLPDLEDRVLEIASVQRMTKNNRKQKYRATVVVGDKNGHIGLGVGKDVEAKPAIDTGIRDAKKHIISVNLGCGSQECNCNAPHSLPLRLSAKCGSAHVILKPAPKGVGIVASDTVRAVLELAGVKDIWTYSRGRTRDVYNMSMATYLALGKLYELKNIEAMKKQA